MARQNILVELDALLDTRMGTLARIDPKLPTLIGDAYWRRQSDDFEALSNGVVTNERFRELYRQRDKTTLANSIVSNVVHLLGVMTRALQCKKTTADQIDEIIVTVNYHPYQFTDAEKTELQKAMYGFLALSAKVELINQPVKEITPTVLRDQYDAYILYDYNEWDGYHRATLMRQPMHDMTLICPELYLVGRVPTEDDLKGPDGETYDPFKVVALAMMEWVIIEHHPASMFSMCHPCFDPTNSLYSSTSTP